MRLVAGLRPDYTGELTALPISPSWILGEGKGREEGKKRGGKEERGKGKRRMRNGTTPNKKSWLRACYTMMAVVSVCLSV